MAITRVQYASGFTDSSAGGLDITLTLGSAPTNGNTLIIAFHFASNSGAALTSISQTGATWTQIAAATSSPLGAGQTQIWMAANVSGAGTTINFTSTNNNIAQCAIVAEYSGLTSSPSDVHATNTQNTSVAVVSTGTTATTSQANELWIGAYGIKYSGSVPTISALTNSYTMITTQNSTTPSSSLLGMSEYFASATGTAGDTATLSSAYTSVGASATFLGASGGAPVRRRCSMSMS